MKLNKTVLIAVGIAIALVIGSILVTYETKLADQKTENEKYVKALNDTLKVIKNKAGENMAKIRVLETKSEKDFLKLQSKDADIKTLQDRVAYYKGKAESVVTFTQQGTVTGTTNTQITHKDTTGLVKCDSCPVYTNTFTDTWVTLKTTTDCNKQDFNLKYKDDYAVSVVMDKGTRYLEVISKSPYSVTTEARMYKVDDAPKKNKRWGLGINAGYGLILTDNVVRTGPYFGVGIQYNIIRW